MQIRLKEIMQEKGLTSVALASMVGLSKNTISNLINNKTKPSLDTLNEIAEKIDVPLWQLFASPEEVQKENEQTVCPHCGKPIKITLTKE